jgi:hypothetical protein
MGLLFVLALQQVSAPQPLVPFGGLHQDEIFMNISNPFDIRSILMTFLVEPDHLVKP